MNQRTGRDPKSGAIIRVALAQGRIAAVERTTDKVPQAALPWIALAFFDAQINGWNGVDYGAADIRAEQITASLQALVKFGVSQVLPTLITNSAARFETSLRAIVAAHHAEGGQGIAGVHLEGPYLSDRDGPRGAHPAEHCKDPDWDEFRRWQDAADGLIRLVTLAPERRGAIDFIERAVQTGVRVAIGHTGADAATLDAAVGAGATLSTHLGNAADDRIQRHHNYIFDQLADDRLLASLIVDGHHLPASLVKIFVRVKGTGRIVLVSDAVHLGGMPAGQYPFGNLRVDVRGDGYIGVVGRPRLAGSGTPLVRGIENLIRFADVSLADAVDCATANPRRWLGLDGADGLVVGAFADLVLFEWNDIDKRIDIVETIVAGRSAYCAKSPETAT